MEKDILGKEKIFYKMLNISRGRNGEKGEKDDILDGKGGGGGYVYSLNLALIWEGGEVKIVCCFLGKVFFLF